MCKTKNVMIVGVGGQGTLLASKILGAVMMAAGYDVKVSEVHGMSQRGGSVVTYVRYGKEVHSPIIDIGEADYILSFEELEAARYLPFLNENGKIIVNKQMISPMPVIIGAMQYPENLIDKLKASGKKVISFDALSIAEMVNMPKAVNIVLLGIMAKNAEFPKELWIKAIQKCVPEKFLEANLKAFQLAYEFQQ